MMKTAVLCLLAIGLWAVCDGKQCKRDLVFIVDSSGSISDSEYGDMIKFMTNVVKDGGAIGKDKVQVGVIIYAKYTKSKIVLQLKDQNASKNQLIAFINGIQRLSKGQTTHTFWTLTNLLPKAFLATNGARAGVPRVAILLTDGVAKDSKTKYKTTGLAAIQNNNIKMYVVGIGDKLNKAELVEIAGSSNRVFYAGSYAKLVSMANPFIDETNCGQPGVKRKCYDFSGQCARDKALLKACPPGETSCYIRVKPAKKGYIVVRGCGAPHMCAGFRKLYGKRAACFECKSDACNNRDNPSCRGEL